MQQGSRNREWEQVESLSCLCPLHIRVKTLPESTARLLAKLLLGSLKAVVTKDLCFF
jgi:hypothetical protein